MNSYTGKQSIDVILNSFELIRRKRTTYNLKDWCFNWVMDLFGENITERGSHPLKRCFRLKNYDTEYVSAESFSAEVCHENGVWLNESVASLSGIKHFWIFEKTLRSWKEKKTEAIIFIQVTKKDIRRKQKILSDKNINLVGYWKKGNRSIIWDPLTERRIPLRANLYIFLICEEGKYQYKQILGKLKCYTRYHEE